MIGSAVKFGDANPSSYIDLFDVSRNYRWSLCWEKTYKSTMMFVGADRILLRNVTIRHPSYKEIGLE